MPVKLVTTAEPPVNSIAVTRMLVMSPKTIKTQCVTAPYLRFHQHGKLRSPISKYLPRIDDFQESVSIGTTSLELDGKRCKQDNLNCSS